MQHPFQLSVTCSIRRYGITVLHCLAVAFYVSGIIYFQCSKLRRVLEIKASYPSNSYYITSVFSYTMTQCNTECQIFSYASIPSPDTHYQLNDKQLEQNKRFNWQHLILLSILPKQLLSKEFQSFFARHLDKSPITD